jgi:sialic acid synthase SpsE
MREPPTTPAAPAAVRATDGAGSRFFIADRQIGPESPVLVIAEIGVNHDGSTRRALELVDIAHAAGADAVKLQIFTAAQLMHASASFAAYQRQRVEDADPAAMLRRYELGPDDLRRVISAIRQRGMIPLATPFSLGDVDVVNGLDLPAVKIASPDLVNLPLLRRAAALDRPMLVSCGAATMEEVETTVNWLRRWKSSFALLHCISSYPAPDVDANLRWIGELATRFNVVAGYSDHTTHEISGALAVASGARIIEKHLTYDRGASGPDHSASADPDQFARYIRAIRLAQALRGSPGKRVLDAEADVRVASRQSLVLCRAIAAKEAIRECDLIVQRPATGIGAAQIDRVIGARAKIPLPAGTMLQWDALEIQSVA